MIDGWRQCSLGFGIFGIGFVFAVDRESCLFFFDEGYAKRNGYMFCS